MSAPVGVREQDTRLRNLTTHPSVYAALQRHNDVAVCTAFEAEDHAANVDHPAIHEHMVRQAAYAQGIADYSAWLKGGESTTALASLLEV